MSPNLPAASYFFITRARQLFLRSCYFAIELFREKAEQKKYDYFVHKICCSVFNYQIATYRRYLRKNFKLFNKSSSLLNWVLDMIIKTQISFLFLETKCGTNRFNRDLPDSSYSDFIAYGDNSSIIDVSSRLLFRLQI